MEQGVTESYLYPFLGPMCNGLLITETGDHDIVTELGFDILSESGACTSIFDVPRVDMSFSKNGNQSFSNIVGAPLNSRGFYKNQIRFDRMGQANEFTVQLRFWGFQRFVVKDGFAELML